MTKRILLVEDDDIVAVYMQAALESGGYEVDRAATAYGAIIRMKRGRFDLVLMDLTLLSTSRIAEDTPDDGLPRIRREDEVNGIVVTFALRGLGYNGPIISITGGALLPETDIEEACGFVEKLMKPAMPDEVLAAVARAIGPSAQEAGAPDADPN